jgi:hypothetical protein
MTNKYHILEIKLKNIDINKLKDVEFVKKKKDTLFLSYDGLYKIIDNNYYKFKLIDNDAYIYNNFLDDYTLYHSNSFWKKSMITSIPFDIETIDINYIEIKLNEYSKNTMVIEILNGKIIDLYFLSNMSKDDYSFKEDISLFIKMIM